MSEDMQKKLYDYEETPPAKTWDKIAAALVEEIYAEFPQKLYRAEIVPPVNVWNKIVLALDDVAEEYPSKLYSLEILPPAGTWQKISSALDQGEALPKISRKGKIMPFVRYAVAASIIGLIAFGVKFLNSNSSPDIERQEPKAASTVPLQPQNIKTPDEQQPAVATNNLPKPQVILASNNEAFKKHHTQTGYMTELADVSNTENKVVNENDFQRASLQGSVPGSQSFINNSAERYLTLTGPDGYLVRISRKLAETLGCLYTTTGSEEYKNCVEQIKKWREKIAQSPVTPSPLDLIKSMQEKEL